MNDNDMETRHMDSHLTQPLYEGLGMYTDARVQRIFGGANEVMREVVARAL